MINKKFKDYLNSIKPTDKFNSNNVPTEPDYLDLDNWVAHPSIDGNQQLHPLNNELSNKTKDVDVFYIHPTGFFGQEWNGSVDRSSASFERSEIQIASQATAFNATCNVYAPEYRQATYYTFYDLEGDGYLAQDLAYSDIERAFDTYIDKYNDNKPFFIASHSQGALHGQRLIHNRIANSSLQKNFIAGYLIGYIVPIQHFDVLYPGLSVSNSETDTNTIISWCSGVVGFTRPRAHSMFWLPSGWVREKQEQPLVCQNPLSWKTGNEWVEADENIAIRVKLNNQGLSDYYSDKHSGSKITIEATRVQEFKSRVSNIDMVEVDGPLIKKVKRFSANGDLHNFDISLFWGAIETNAALRANSF